jgi:EAL domain-containing protein (putative c-di-GMP-specific phosphodiesterase class I)
MNTDGDDAAIVQAIVELAHTLDLKVVAEGVEDQPTWDLLRASGVDVVQGFYLARPMSAADFVAWYTERKASVDSLSGAIPPSRLATG